MAREVDPDLQRRRRDVLDLLAMARVDVAAIADKCDEVTSLTSVQLRGHGRGERVIEQSVRAAELLHSAVSSLLSASEAARGIDVTVEVPDEEPSDG